MIALGKECSSWDDSVDIANLEQFDCGDVPEDEFIMTTWHENESLEEVLRFAKTMAHHPALELHSVLFLHIGTTDREAEISSLFAAAWAADYGRSRQIPASSLTVCYRSDANEKKSAFSLDLNIAHGDNKLDCCTDLLNSPREVDRSLTRP